MPADPRRLRLLLLFQTSDQTSDTQRDRAELVKIPFIHNLTVRKG